MTRLLLTAFLAVCCSPAFAAEPGNLRAGAFAIDITPQRFPISVNGGMTDRQAASAHDPLHARCLVLDDGKTKLALVVVDSCMIPQEILDAAKARAEKATGIPVANMLISATHTHTAPTLGGVFQSEPDEPYIQYLIGRIAEGIEKAHANRVPAQIGSAVVPVPEHLFNRRWIMKAGSLYKDPFGNPEKVKMNPGIQNPDLDKPAGPTDPDLSAIAVKDMAGRPLALYASYGLHYVGGLPALSADYFGVFCDKVGGLLGADAGFVAMLSNGTSGDVNNVNFREPLPKLKPGEKARLVAEAVAKSAQTAYNQAKFMDKLTLAVAEKEIELGVRKPKPEDVERAKQILESAKGRPLKGVEEFYARETVLLAKYPDKVKLKLQAMRIGGLGIAAIPCEVFTEIGLEIKKKSPLPATFTVSLANGYNGYLPTPAQHALGGYETWRARSSYLETSASDTITATILELLKEVAKSKTP